MKFLKWLAQYNKAFVPLTMALIVYVNTKYGIELPISESDVIVLWGLIASAIVWRVPNTKEE